MLEGGIIVSERQVRFNVNLYHLGLTKVKKFRNQWNQWYPLIELSVLHKVNKTSDTHQDYVPGKSEL